MTENSYPHSELVGTLISKELHERVCVLLGRPNDYKLTNCNKPVFVLSSRDDLRITALYADGSTIERRATPRAFIKDGYVE